MECLEMHCIPKYGSWLNIEAEIELSVLQQQCLAGRIPCIEKMREEVHSWHVDRKNLQSNIDCQRSNVDWQFCTDDARIKLKRLCSKL